MSGADTGDDIEQQYDARCLDTLMSSAKIDDKRKAEFEELIKHWAGLNYAAYRDFQRHPTFKHIESKLRAIRKASSELIGRLDEYHVEYELWLAADDNESEGAPVKGFDQIQAVREQISLLEAWARVAINNAAKKKVGKQGTSRRRKARQEAVNELGYIWKLFTGKRPTRSVENAASTDRPQSYGPFQDFVRHALLPIFGLHGVSGIDSDIRQTCRFMDNNPQAEAPSYIHMKRVS